MTNDLYTDQRQALCLILGILVAIADKKTSDIAIHNELLQTDEHDKTLGQWSNNLTNQYNKEIFDENLEDVEYKTTQANNVESVQENVSDDSLLNALQNKSSMVKKYKSQRDMDFSYKKMKTRSFSEWCKDNVDWIMIAFCILTILFCIFAK